jgi:hypothetical protein
VVFEPMKTRNNYLLKANLKYILFPAITGFICVLLVILFFSYPHKQEIQKSEKPLTQNYDSYTRLLLNYKKPLSKLDLIKSMNVLLKLREEGETKNKKNREIKKRMSSADDILRKYSAINIVK